jgi:Superfamily II helicase
MPTFVPGLGLCRSFFFDAVRPLISDAYPGLAYSAALIGPGSEVLGFDTELSTDHDWAPRVQIFLREPDVGAFSEPISRLLDQALPGEFGGYPVFVATGNAPNAPKRHCVEVTTIRQYLLRYLAFDIDQPFEPADWLSFPEHKLRTLVDGAVFQDEANLGAIRDKLRYYPHDIWLYLLASGWQRIGQEEHLMGRAGSVGDEMGSAIIAARLVRDLVRLCFLMEKRYAPYAKWFGTAFSQLDCGPVLEPVLRHVLSADTWQEREQHLCPAYLHVATMHNALGITDPLPTTPGPFFTRPFQVIHLHGRFAKAIRDRVEDVEVRRIAGRGLIRSTDQWSDSTDVCSDPKWRRDLRSFYE